MNGNETHSKEKVMPCDAINIFLLDEPLEYKVLF